LTRPTAVTIPHVHALAAAGDGSKIKAYVRLPDYSSATSPMPVVIFVRGLDAYRTDHTNRTSEHVRRGFACISIEIPGTGDSPAAKRDPFTADRQWSSVIDWIEAQPHLDAKQICIRGVSTGGYYAIRMDHTHPNGLLAVVSHGGGCHRMFDKEWIAAQNNMEYLFA
jgi:dipeptidyl aminopeptidase/acylaminoacyl peptidase